MAKRALDHFEAFGEHTLLKHLILKGYLGTWAAKLLRRPGTPRVWFVDGFAGAGGDEKGNPGSPVIAAEVARRVVSPVRREFPTAEIHIIAVEQQPQAFRRLQEALSPFSSRPGVVVRCHPRSLSEIIEDILIEARNDPILFFLDPFGVRGLRRDLLTPALRGPRNEVFALFSDPGARRLLAVIAASEKDVDEEVRRALAQSSLFAEDNLAREAEVRRRVTKSAESLRRTQTAAREIMGEALGPQGLEVLEKIPPDERQSKAVELYVRCLAEAGANYVIPFRVRDVDGHPRYHLIHASKSPSGMQAMKEAIHTGLKKSELPTHVLERIVVDTRVDVDDVVDRLSRYFAGRTVRWSEGRNRSAETVRGYALRHSAVFPPQLDEVKDALKRAGWVLMERPMTVRFPEVGT